jgi:hypothetical protein
MDAEDMLWTVAMPFELSLFSLTTRNMVLCC